MDYKELGLKVGLEIHFQLATSHKLFCNCPTSLKEKEYKKIVERKLHPVAGELGEVDIAAQYEFLRNRKFEYEVFEDESCLIELDEEPPREVNKEALEIGLKACMLLNCFIPDEIQVMRKTVIDGSNTSGFQRTMLIGVDGFVEYKGKKIKIEQVCLEEDACSLDKIKNGKVFYRLNRLGIPLIEVTTSTIQGFSPKEIQEIALKIGMLIKSLGKIKRGIGSIRQDINISIEKGARVEIKGVQKLEMISKVIEKEVERQLNLLKIREEIIKRGTKEIDERVYEVTKFFENTRSKIIKSILNSGLKIYCFKLPNFSGLLKLKISGEKTFGKEIAEYAKAFGLGGIIHSDEDLKKYNLEKEFDELKKFLKANEKDVVVIIGEKDGKVSKFIVEKLNRFVKNGLEKEVRGANEDGTTHFTRPLPGAARMYPETDVPPVILTQEYLEKLRKELPKTFEERIEEFEKLGINKEIGMQILKNETILNIFEKAVNEICIDPKFVATFLTGKLKELSRKYKIKVEEIKDVILKLFELLKENKITKNVLEDVIVEFSKTKEKIEKIIDELGLWRIDDKELEKRIKEILEQAPEKLKENEKKLMGYVIGKLKKVAEVERIIRFFKKSLNYSSSEK